APVQVCSSQFFDYCNNTTFCTKPPKCILFRPDNPAFHDLDTNIFPIFLIERSVRIKNFSVCCRQVPMCVSQTTRYKERHCQWQLLTSETMVHIEDRVHIATSVLHMSNSAGHVVGKILLYFARSLRKTSRLNHIIKYNELRQLENDAISSWASQDVA
ncbi:hypothetical protein Egran_05340, partial [Elaphomyces granulatus]